MNSTPVVYALLAGDAAVPATLQAARHVARSLGATLAVLAAGPEQLSSDLAAARDASAVYFIALPADAQSHQIVGALADALENGTVPRDTGTVFIATPDGAMDEIAMRLAARLCGMPLGRCESIENGDGGLIVCKAAYGGRLRAVLHAGPGPYFAIMRPPAALTAALAKPTTTDSVAPTVRRITAPTLAPAYELARTPNDDHAIALEGARLIVSGGRGIGETGFTALHELARVLGAAVGGSLPAVDAGWVPVARQIGQSGKYVSPDIYVAVGISGTPQHLAGIDPHTRIVAINKDADAWIFGRAAVGVVADWEIFLPELTAALAAPADA
jgi:electron transfer flavoprotein alpha subunit